MDLKVQYDKLLRYCYAITKDRYLSEDITQETFLRFWESRSYKDTGKEQAYLYKIARNLCMDEFRRPQTLELESCEDDEALQCNDIEEHLAQLELDSALSKLPEEQREIVILRYANGVKVSDIGKILGISRFAVLRRLKEALSELRDIMEGGNR